MVFSLLTPPLHVGFTWNRPLAGPVARRPYVQRDPFHIDRFSKTPSADPRPKPEKTLSGDSKVHARYYKEMHIIYIYIYIYICIYIDIHI